MQKRKIFAPVLEIQAFGRRASSEGPGLLMLLTNRLLMGKVNTSFLGGAQEANDLSV